MTNHPYRLASILASAALVIGCVTPASTPSTSGQLASAPVQPGDNTLLAAWEGPYGGLPAFDEVQLEDLPQALEYGMAKALSEVDRIAENPAPPTFDNTIVAMEGVGRDLSRVMTYYRIWSSNKSSPEFRELQSQWAPKLSEYTSKIRQNERLFERVRAVYESDEYRELPEAKQRLVWLRYNRFARNGATLEGAAKERYAAINRQLAELHTKFANNVLADEESYVTF
ncbi:MAG: M3 family peptidase, partial [Gammaproteobacteria bacterium]|nr:M3 family peptidase [Gammaproteobacteria bacterium]